MTVATGWGAVSISTGGRGGADTLLERRQVGRIADEPHRGSEKGLSVGRSALERRDERGLEISTEDPLRVLGLGKGNFLCVHARALALENRRKLLRRLLLDVFAAEPDVRQELLRRLLRAPDRSEEEEHPHRRHDDEQREDEELKEQRGPTSRLLAGLFALKNWVYPGHESGSPRPPVHSAAVGSRRTRAGRRRVGNTGHDPLGDVAPAA